MTYLIEVRTKGDVSAAWRDWFASSMFQPTVTDKFTAMGLVSMIRRNFPQYDARWTEQPKVKVRTAGAWL